MPNNEYWLRGAPCIRQTTLGGRLPELSRKSHLALLLIMIHVLSRHAGIYFRACSGCVCMHAGQMFAAKLWRS